MVAQRLPQYMTLDEYYELMRKNPDAKYEYLDGQVYLVAGGTASGSALSTHYRQRIPVVKSMCGHLSYE